MSIQANQTTPISYSNTNLNKVESNSISFSSWAEELNKNLDKVAEEAKTSGHDERNEYVKNPQQKAQTNFEKALNAVKNITNADTGEKFEFESLSL